jgi:alginate O-acetyltransferase complex protein AlgJ
MSVTIREERRKTHVRRDSSSRDVLAGFLFLAFLALGLAAAITGMLGIALPHEADVWNGEWASRFQNSFQESLPITDLAVHSFSALRYALFRQGASGVEVGRRGWLFTTEELKVRRGDSKRMERSLAYIEEVARELENRGVLLAVVVIPAKARVHREALPGFDIPEAIAGRYARTLETLSSMHNVVSVDALPKLLSVKNGSGEEAPFLRTDTHWTPRGAAVAAEAAAAALEPHLSRRGVSRRRFRTERTGVISHTGDLRRFLPLGPFAAPLGLSDEIVEQYETLARSSTGDLFADPRVPAALVGTSYSAGELWNFPGFLKEALSVDLLNVAMEGRGPFIPMSEYLESETIREHEPQLVIWEIPERYLAHPDYPPGANR